MSATATFQLETELKADEIERHLSEIWKGEYVDITEEPDKERIEVVLSYCYGDEAERQQIRSAIKYLISISSKKMIYYIRDNDGYIEGADPDYLNPLTLDDVFSNEFYPSLHSGIHYRYLIKG